VRAPSDPSFEPLFLALAVVAAIAYRRAKRSDQAPRWRRWLFALGVVALAASLNSPLETLAAQYLLLFHLLQNVIIADWAPLLIVLGLTPAMRAGIARRLGPWFRTLTKLRVALPVWLAGWYLIHLGSFYDTALRNPWLLNVEHLVLLLIGLLFWWPLVSDTPNTPSTPARVGYLGIGFLSSMFLGLALTFAGSIFYGYYRGVPRLWGFSPLEDQNLAGIVMTAEQSVTFLVAMGYFLVRLLNEEETREQASSSFDRNPATPPPTEAASGRPGEARDRASSADCDATVAPRGPATRSQR
jgi:cytochrome c oxidase assembly factor CtaG